MAVVGPPKAFHVGPKPQAPSPGLGNFLGPAERPENDGVDLNGGIKILATVVQDTITCGP